MHQLKGDWLHNHIGNIDFSYQTTTTALDQWLILLGYDTLLNNQEEISVDLKMMIQNS